jgi:hypothetical protein
MKMLITVLAIAIVIGGWALLAANELTPTDALSSSVASTGSSAPAQTEQTGIEGDMPPQPQISLQFDAIPTVMPAPDSPAPVTIEQPASPPPAIQVSQPAAPQPELRQVTAPAPAPAAAPAPAQPAPVTTTNSSR